MPIFYRVIQQILIPVEASTVDISSVGRLEGLDPQLVLVNELRKKFNFFSANTKRIKESKPINATKYLWKIIA